MVVLAAALFCRCYLATVGLFIVALAVDGLYEPDMFPFYVDARLIGKVLLVAVFPATLDLLRRALARDPWARARYGF